MRTLVLLFLLFGAFPLSNAQSSPQPKFAVFIVDGLTGPEQCRFIDREMRKLEFVMVSRMDIPTSRYLIQFMDNAPYTEAWFTDKFLTWGLTIHCYTEGYTGLKEACQVTKDNCAELKN